MENREQMIVALVVLGIIWCWIFYEMKIAPDENELMNNIDKFDKKRNE